MIRVVVAAGFCATTALPAQQMVEGSTGKSTSQSPSGIGGELSYAHHTPFACATIPARLAGIAEGRRRLVWREHWPDTSVAKHVTDSLARMAIRRTIRDEIHRCLAAHPLASIPPRQRLGLGFAQLAANDDALARATFRQVIQASATAPLAERAWILSRIVEAYVGEGPEKIPTALEYMAQLDALGPAVAGRRLATRVGIYGLAQGMDSLPFMESQARAALQTSAELDGDGKIEWKGQRVAAIVNWADVESRRGRYAEAMKFLWANDKDFPNGELGYELYKTGLYGTAVKPLQASALYVPGDTTPVTRPPLPVKGKPSLLVAVSARDLERAMPMYMMLQRIKAKYDVNLVLVTETSGWDYDGLLPKAEVESSRVRTFFHDYLSMPASLVVWTQRSTGALPDGRLTFEQNPNPLPVGGWTPLGLVDREGIIRMVTMGGQEIRLNHMIEELTR